MKPKYIIIHSHAIKIIDKNGKEYTPSDWLVHLGFSCHGFFHSDGSKEMWVKKNKVAYHAGVSKWGTDEDLNQCSLGYEITINNSYNWATWRRLIKLQSSFTDEMYSCLAKECAKDCIKWNLNPYSKILTHDMVSGKHVRPDNPKIDAGEGFDLYRLQSMTDAEIESIKTKNK